ncbi:SLATT domain-containing protein [Stenotrophomonas maltophilia]|uniref:SLATT domain-containing protein n=1 Tax=Stenotrophomonas maltophilia TaxID=40324 RepID=UPI0028945442|nr:SLATT domain-containing protein [Stenotrophomonas maltophilia]MDT3500634.1 SLATT domain-containing protein [Stenotrophomonas maltophilia]
MGELDDRVKELLRRTKITTKSRYRASERLERHHKFSQWTVSLISVALVFVPMMQAFNIKTGVDAIYLNATQAILAVLVLVYSLLLGQENFISRSEAMQRNGVELSRYARRLAGISAPVSDERYSQLTEDYYDILERYGNHKPIDYLYTQLAESPKTFGESLVYSYRWVKARLTTVLIFSHYFIAMAFVGYVFISLLLSIQESYAR